MARSAASIQAEITAIETLLQSSAGLSTSVGADGVSRSINRPGLEARLDKLYQQLERVDGSAPVIVRGVVKGLR
jgi:hypothetical protein